MIDYIHKGDYYNVDEFDDLDDIIDNKYVDKLIQIDIDSYKTTFTVDKMKNMKRKIELIQNMIIMYQLSRGFDYLKSYDVPLSNEIE